jgi:DNA polymerase-3 subunit alpha (Gram-positive type)
LSKEREKFEILLDQMNLDPELQKHPLLQTGKMTQVVVHRQSKCWSFTLGFEKILPAELYQNFYQHLELAFKDIAAVQLQLETEDKQFDEQLLQDYWSLALANQNCDTPLVKQVLKSQFPKMQEKKNCVACNQ